MSKPENWDKMPEIEKNDVGEQFFRTTRGRLMIGKALFIASREMRKQKYPEHSDADDMEILGETLFSFGYNIEIAMEEYKASNAV